MVAGPKMSCLAKELEDLYLLKSDIRDSHHEQIKSAQRNFHQNVRSLRETLSDPDNPFTDQSEDLISLVHKVIADVFVVQTVREDERTGQDMYPAFVEVRSIKREKKVFDPRKKNSISLFRTPITKVEQQESVPT